MCDELVKRMWECASGECFSCSQYTPTTNASVCQKELMKQAADAIEELIKDRDNWKVTAKEEREMYWHWFDNYQRDVPSWIPVTERLPEPEEDVLVLFPHNQAVAYMLDDGRWQVNSGDGWSTDIDLESGEKDPTHWMPLPQPPKEE